MKKTLLILAGGMGSRFGGLKQIEPIGPNGEFLIHYSIYDAIKTGFNKIVFLIKEENYEIFKKKIGDMIKNDVEVHYVFQKNDSLKQYVDIPDTREKPLGTAHAIYCAKDIIKENFTIINADDFYGRESYELLSKLMDENNSDFVIAGYPLGNTVTDNGSTKRGICVMKDGKLVELTESVVEKTGDTFKAKSLIGSNDVEVSFDSLVSMNMIAFTPKFLEYLDENVVDFFNNNIDKIDTIEYLAVDVMNEMFQKGIVNISVIKTPAKWIGMTYREDKEIVMNEINKLIEDGTYPLKLFN